MAPLAHWHKAGALVYIRILGKVPLTNTSLWITQVFLEASQLELSLYMMLLCNGALQTSPGMLERPHFLLNNTVYLKRVETGANASQGIYMPLYRSGSLR